jgi:hypothetical protein
VDLAVESGGTSGVCYISNAGDVYKSTNGGYFFGLAEPSEVTLVNCLSMAPMYPALPEAGHLIVGGDAEVSYSTDSADSFTLIDSGLSGNDCVVGADENYATNNTIYAASNAGEVFRFVIGTDSSWTDLGANGGTMDGLALNNGVLYAADSDASQGVYRTLTPLAAAGTLDWEQMNTGTAVNAEFDKVPNSLRVVNNVAYALDNAADPDELEAYNDPLATAVPVLTGPADGATLAVDPVTGYAELVTLSWESMGTGDGLVTDYDIWVTKADDTEWASPNTFNSEAVNEPTAPSRTFAAGGAGAEEDLSMLPNTSYMWRVRAENEVSTDNIMGQWSEARILNVQAGGIVQAPQFGPQLQGPIHGATNVSVNPGFSWAPIYGATLYRFWLALDSTLTMTVEGTPVDVTEPAWQVPAGTLEYDTVYFWGVRAIEPTESPLSIGTFTTMAEPAPAVAEAPPTPAYIWAIIVIGAGLMLFVIVLIMKTRRVV